MNRTLYFRNKRKGSTFILVIAILSLLVLIATTMALTSRVEVNSSSNYAEGMQSRISAYTGVHSAAEEFKTKQNNSILKTSNSLISIYDESSRININTADEKLLEKLFSLVFIENKIKFGDPAAMAKEIVEWRLGPDGKPGIAGVDDNCNSNDSNPVTDKIDTDKDGQIDNPEERYYSVNADGIDNNHDGIIDEKTDGFETDGIDNDKDGKIDENNEGIDDPDEYIPDPRIRPNGDDRPFVSIYDLKELKSFSNNVIFETVAPYLTTISIDLPCTFVNDELKPKIAINVLDAQELYNVLSEKLGVSNDEKNVARLKQYCSNLVDARDRDNIPTVFPGSSPKRPVLGVEKNPYIYEVLADSITETRKWKDKKGREREENDDGEYIELYNPYPEEISIDKWKILITANRQGNSFDREISIPLSGKIQPKSFLIITDDYNENNDSSPEDYESKYGSFLGIFNKTQNGTNKKILEMNTLDIPDYEGIIYLTDGKGNVIDYFEYTGAKFDGAMKACVRLDPRVKVYDKHSPNPFELNLAGAAAPAADFFKTCGTESRDHRFEDEIELLNISTGYDLGSQNTGEIFSKPALKKSGKGGINISMLAEVTNLEIGTDGYKMFKPAAIDLDNETLKTLQTMKTIPKIYGRVNINTASSIVLEALFADLDEIRSKYQTSSLLNKLPKNINIKLTTTRKKKSHPLLPSGFDPVIYNGEIIDLLGDEETYKQYSADDMLAIVKGLYSRLTTSTYSFTMISENNPAEYIARKHQNRIKVLSVITMDNAQRNPDMQYISYLH